MIGILALLGVVVVVAVTGSVPTQLFDVTMGLNRSCERMLTDAALMRDGYPPLRVEGGGTEPGTRPAQGELALAA